MSERTLKTSGGWVLVLLMFMGCGGSAPRPPYVAPILISDKEVCQGEVLTLSPKVSNPSLYQFHWSPENLFEDPSLPEQTISLNSDANITLRATHLETGYTFEKTIHITVHPLPRASAGPQKIICEGESTTIGDNDDNSLIYFWSPSYGLNSNTLPEPTASPLTTTTYTLTATSPESGCSITDTVEVIVNPTPTAYFSSPSSICLYSTDGTPSSVNFTNMSTGPVSMFIWDFGDGTISNEENPVHTYSFSGKYEINLHIISPDGCGSTFVRNLTVMNNPVITSINTFPSHRLCGPGEVQFYAIHSGTPPFRYLWDFGDGITSTEPIPIHTYTKPGSYTVVLEVNDATGCGTRSSTTVEVLSLPAPSFIATNICEKDENGIPQPVRFFNTTTGDIESVLWDFGDGITSTEFSPSHTYALPGTYTVTLTVKTSEGCSSSVTSTVTVYPSPSINNLNHSPAHLCGGGDVTFSAVISGGNPPFSYQWNFGDGSSSNLPSPTHTYSNPGVYNVTLRINDSKGCSAKRTTSFSVFTPPSLSLNTDKGEVCEGRSVRITGNYFSPSPITAQVIYTGDGNWFPVSTTSYTYTSPSTYIIKYTAFTEEGCYSSITHPVVIRPSPKAEFTSNSPVCFGGDVTFINTSTGANYFQWNFGDGEGSTEKNPSHFYLNPGNYTVTLRAVNEYMCEDTFSASVTVNPVPIPSFNYLGNECTNETISFINTSTGASDYLWDFGNGITSVETHPIISYSTSGTYRVTLTASNPSGCTATYYEVLEITSPPHVSLGRDRIVARGSYITLGGSVSGGVPPYSYFWQEMPERNYASPLTAPNPIMTVPSTAPIEIITYTLSVTDFKGCFDPYFSVDSMAVSITDQLTVSAGPDREICKGESVSIGDVAGGGIPPYQYLWTPSEGLADPFTSPTVASPPSTITYTLSVTDASPQTVTDTVTIKVNPNPITAIILPSQTVLCGLPAGVSFSAVVTGGTPPYSYIWDFGDTSQGYGQFVNHIYSSPGTYTVTLFVQDTNGCPPTPLTDTVKITVVDIPIADFSTNSPQCYLNINDEPHIIYFTNLTSSQNPINLYYWDFNDPFVSNATSTLQNPSYTYSQPGIYYPALFVRDSYGCWDAVSHMVKVYENPFAYFTAPSPQCISLPVNFQNQSSGNNLSYLWNFGDGATSTELSPSHLYSSVGTYTASLYVKDINSCEDIFSAPVQIITPADAGTDKWVYTGECVQIGSAPQTNFSYYWISSPPDQSLIGQETSPTPIVCPLKETTYTVQATSPWGCWGSDSTTVKVYMKVTYTYPELGNLAVPINHKILITFSEGITPPSINSTSIKLVEIGGPTEQVVNGTYEYDAPTRTVIFTPSSPLTTNMDYEIRVSADPATGVISVNGNLLKENFLSAFRTSLSSDTTPPSLISYYPTGTNVPYTVQVLATFNETLNPINVNNTTFYLEDEFGNRVTGTIYYDIPSKTIYFKPVTDFSPETTYRVFINGVKDMAGNSLTLLPAWQFTTSPIPDTTPPYIISTDPADGEIGVNQASLIYAYFSEPIDPTSISGSSFIVMDENSNILSGTVSYNPAITAIVFTPSSFLSALSWYTVTVSGIKDTAGNPMISDYTWTFKTGAPAWEPGDDPSQFSIQAICNGTSGDIFWVEDYTDYHSPPFSWMYNVRATGDPHNQNCYISSANPIDLSIYDDLATLSFYQKISLKSKGLKGDYGTVEVCETSSDCSSCSVWNEAGRYSGKITVWMRTEVDLSPYIGKNICVRFRVRTDNRVPSDYWKIDDILITGE